nr:hypothetical protein [Tanacetum cinerariifolium]
MLVIRLVELLGLDFLQTYELINIVVDVFEYHFQVKRMIIKVTDINKRTKSKPKPDKIEHEMEKSGKVKVKVNQVKVKVNQVKVKDEAEIKEMLNGPARTHLIGRDMPIKHLHEDL